MDLPSRDPEERSVPIGEMNIQWLKKLEDEDVLSGVTFVFGVMHHIQFIRVHDVDGVQTGTLDPYSRLDDMYQLYEGGGAFKTVEVPGFEGEYVCCIFPGQ